MQWHEWSDMSKLQNPFFLPVGFSTIHMQDSAIKLTTEQTDWVDT